MFNIFIGIIIIQALFGFALENYFFTPTLKATPYIFKFNLLFSAFVIVMVLIYMFMIKNNKKTLTQINGLILNGLKHVWIVNLIGILLAQGVFVQFYRAYTYFKPYN